MHATFKSVGLLLCVAVLAGCGNKMDASIPVAQEPGQEQGNYLPAGLPDHFAPSGTFYPIVADKTTGIYHRAACPLVSPLPGGKKAFFRNSNQAKAQGLKPCKECRP